MKPARPPVLLLDVMGTLVYDPFYREVPRFFELSLDELIAAKTPHAWGEFERGHIDEAELARTFFRDGRPLDVEGLKRCMRDAFRYLDGIEPLLADLRAAGCELHALSNYAPWYALIEERLQLSRYLEWSFVSCDLGLRKPEPEIYLTAARRLERSPQELLFVDDREENCSAARALGLDALLFEDAAALRGALVARGLLAS